MAEGRTVKIRITGDPADFIKAMDAAGYSADVAGKKIGDSADKMSSKMGGAFSSIGNAIQNFTGIPVAEHFDKLGEKFDEADSKGKGLTQTLSTLGGAALLGVGVAAAGVAVESIHLAETFNATTATIAANGDITTAAAQKIGNAFLDTAGTTIYSGQQIATAYAGVVGQLTAVQGHALNAKQAMVVMSASMDLAEASGTSLNTATAAVSGVLQAFQQNLKSSASDADILFNAAKDTGTSVDSFASSVEKLRAKLGETAPSFAQTSGLIVDLTEHGETGRAAISAVSTALTTLVTKSTAASAAQQTANATFAQLPPNLQAVATGYKNGTVTAKDLTDITKNLSGSQGILLKAFASAQDKVTSASSAYKDLGLKVTDANGKFAGIGPILSQVDAHLTTLQGNTAKMAYLQTVFGTSSARLLETVEAGPAAFDKYTASVAKTNSAHEAAEKQSQTLHHQIELLQATAEDYGVKIGEFLIPKLDALMKITAGVIVWFTKHKDAAIALGVVIGGVLTAAIGAYVVLTGVKFVKATGEAVEALGKLGSGLLTAGKWLAANVASTAKWVVENAKDMAMAVKDFAVMLAEHTAGAVTFIAENVAMAASAVAAFIAENAATLGIVAGIAVLVGAIIYMATHWKQTWDAIKDVMHDAQVFIVSHLKLIMFLPVIGELIFLGEKWHTIWDAIKIVLRDAWSVIHAVFSLIKTVAIDPIIIEIQILRTIWQTVWSAITSVLQSAWSILQSIFNVIVNNGIRFVRNEIQILQAVWSTVWSVVQSVLSTSWSIMSSVFNAIKTLGIDVISGAIGALELVWSIVWNGIQTTVQAVWSVVGPIFTDIKNAISDITGGISKVTSLASKIPGAGLLAKFAAEGGPIAANQPYIVGEQGPELFIPSMNGNMIPNADLSSPSVVGRGIGGQGGQGMQLSVELNLNGQTLANAVQTVLLQKGRTVVALGLT